ncbi:MAG: hypothetical protein Q4D93_02985 [Porphyromonas sp.]|nr:hypothetical protein [Porphyromonas sp.]
MIHSMQTFRLSLAAALSLTGILLLMLGFWVTPPGEIHQSVLIAFGEVMTFVGGLIGIDYVARQRVMGGDEGDPPATTC